MKKKYDLHTRTRRMPLREEIFSGGGPNKSAAFGATQEKLQKLHDNGMNSLELQLDKVAKRDGLEAFDKNYFAGFEVYDGKPYLRIRITYQLRPKRKLVLVK